MNTRHSFINDIDAYRNPESTQKIMVGNRILWAWHDVISVDAIQANYDRLYLITAHEGFINLPFDIDSLKNASDRIDQQKFSGVNVQLYELNK